METSERQAKQVIVMRTDLNMRKGKMVAQGAHASLKAFLHAERATEPRDGSEHPWDAPLRAWNESGTAKICVGVDSEDELIRVLSEAAKAGLPVSIVTDAGHTEFHGVPTRTCIAIGPCWADRVDPITGELRLL